MPPNFRKGFTLIELIAVVTILGIMASGAAYSINQALRVHRQRQAAELLGNLIRSVRTNALSLEVDTSNPLYFHQGKPTRNAFALYFCQGWVLADPYQTNSLKDTVGTGSGSSDGYNYSYSVLAVNDPGYETTKRIQGPDLGFGEGDDAVSSLSLIENGVSLTGNLRIRNEFINLPEGTWLRYGGAGDNTFESTGGAVQGCQYVTYDSLGNLNLKIGTGAFPGAWTSSGFNGKPAYIGIVSGSADLVQWDSSISPLFVDLRTGDVVHQMEEFDKVQSTFPLFQN